MPSLPPFIVEIDANDAISTAGLFVLGTSVLGGADVLAPDQRWVAVSSGDTREIGIRRGRTREDSAVDVGTATILLDNYSGKYDPDNTAGTYFYTYGGVNLLREGVAVRVKVTVAGVTYTLFTGKLESATSTFGREPTATWTVVDPIDVIGHYGVAPLATYQRENETSSARAIWLLNYANVPTANYVVATGGRPLYRTRGGGTVLSNLEDIARSEQGRVFADRSGKILVRWNTAEVGRPAVVTFSDAAPAAASAGYVDVYADSYVGDPSVEYDEIDVEPGTRQVVNQSTVTRVTIKNDADEASAADYYTGAYDGTSAAKYGPRPVSIDTVLRDDADVRKLATYLATYRSTPRTRPAQIGADLPGTPDTQLAALCGLELGDYVAIARTTPDGRSLAWTVAVEGIDHTITTTGWRLVLHNSPTATTLTW